MTDLATPAAAVAVAALTAQAIYTPHPVTLDGQRRETLNVGETVRQFLERVAAETQPEALEVHLNGVFLPAEHYAHVRPKAGTLVEVRGIVKKQVLYIVALTALAYFTMGIATGGVAALGVAGGTMTASVLGAVTFAAGPALGGKVVR